MKKFTMPKSLIVVLTILISFVVLSVNASAGLMINTYERGWYRSSGLHDPTNDNYLVGDLFPQGVSHNFFVFDLSGVTDTICCAQLFLFNPVNGFSSNDPNETYDLFDVSTDIATLITGGMGLVAIFDDLGSGISFGSATVSDADEGNFVQIVLNPSAIAALNAAAGSSFAIGGAITTLDQDTNDEYVFGFTDTSNPADGNTYLELGFEGCDGETCEEAQQAAQEAVDSGGPYRNHGQLVRTAAKAANPYLKSGEISEECHSCIVNQFARGIPIEGQEVCTDAPAPTGCCFEVGVSCDEQVTEQDCPSGHAWIENGLCDGVNGCGEPL